VPRTATLEPMFETTTLPNGVRILTARMAGAPSVAVFVGLAAGSRYEQPAAAGIAHFAEHMFFKGTERRPTARDISAEIDGIGGEFNAFTGKELTAYYVKCAAASAPVAIDVLSDMLLASRFDAEEIEREKGVIAEEINMYLDTPRDLIGQVHDDLRFGDTPLGRPIIGSKETVGAATRETFLDYLGTWYRPERMVIGLGGAITDAMVDDVATRFGGLDAVHTPPPPVTELPVISGPTVRIEHRDSDQAHLILSVAGQPVGHPDRYVLSVLQAVLGGGMSSRLFTEVRERRGLAYYVFASHAGYTDTGALYVQAGVDTKRIELAVETIWSELRRMATEPVPEDEIAKAKRYITGRTVLGVEDARGMILHGLRRSLIEGAPVELEEIFAGIEAVTAADVSRVAAELIRRDTAALAVIGPFDDAEGLRGAIGEG
jgi:predicted Zn-dependent peptidase